MLEKITNYFEDLAKKHPKIKHSEQNPRFVGGSFAEFFAKKRANLDVLNFCVMFTFVSSDLTEQNADQGILHFTCMISIFKSIGKEKPSTETLKVTSQALEIQLDFYRAINYDSQQRNKGNKDIIPFDYAEMKNVGFDPLADKVSVESAGITFMFTAKMNVDLTYKADKWQD